MKGNKEVCSECGRLLRKKRFRINPLLKKKICIRCDKRIGHNKFYAPEIKTIKKFYPYGIKKDEEEVILDKKFNQGKDARKELNFLKTYVKRFYNKRKYEEKNKKDINKKFVEGLKCM